MNRLKQPSVEQFLRRYPENIREIAQELRALISETVPENREAVYPGWKLIGYRAMAGTQSFYFGFIAPFPDKVVLGFEYGMMLADPNGILEGAGSQVRQVVLRSRKEIRRNQLTPLILEASAIAMERRKRT